MCSTFFVAVSNSPGQVLRCDACTRLLTETFEPELTTAATQFDRQSDTTAVVEMGPRMSFSTAWSANAVSICHSCGLSKITRMEKSHRYQLRSRKQMSQQQQLAFAAMVRAAPLQQVAARFTLQQSFHYLSNTETT